MFIEFLTLNIIPLEFAMTELIPPGNAIPLLSKNIEKRFVPVMIFRKMYSPNDFAYPR